MRKGLFRTFRNKLDSHPTLYARLLWNVVVRRRTLAVVDYQGSLGDLVSFCASLPGLRERHRGCFLALITPPAYVGLVESTGLADAAANSYGFLHLLARKLCRPENYYIPTELSSGLDDPWRSVNPPIHTALHFAELLGVTAQMEAVTLTSSERVRKDMKQRLSVANPKDLPLVVVHTGPTWTVKEWPAIYWTKWSKILRAELPVCLIEIGTETSESALHNHAATRLPHAVDWVNRLDVMQVVSLLEQAQLFVGIDSGPLHLATTVGTPSIGLFGPVTGRYRAHPRAPFVCLAADVPCIGCHHDPAGELHWRTGCPYNIRCMPGISPEAVLRASLEMLAERSGQRPPHGVRRLPNL